MSTKLVRALGAFVVLGIVTGCVVHQDDESGVVAPPALSTPGEVSMRVGIEDLLVPGPAAAVSALSLGHPNRVGSIEVPVRSYLPEGEPWATLVWAHGGSFMRGTLDWPESDWAARRFAAAGVRVIAVDYVLASSDVKAPAPANDVLAVSRWAGEALPGPLVLGGASAGAHLAVLAAVGLAECSHAHVQGVVVDLPQEARLEGDAASRTQTPGSQVTPAALVLLYPTLHRVQEESPSVSLLTNGLPEERRFRENRISEMYDFYLGGLDNSQSEEAHPERALETASSCQAGYLQQPAVAGEFDAQTLALLPPTIMVNAEADDLRVSGEQFARQLAAAGVSTTTHIEPGTVHGYMNRPLASPQAEADAQRTIDTFIQDLRATLDISLS